jgi:Cysteine-rich secretory protein family
MSIIQPVLTSSQITEITNYVNNYRSLNQADPLIWDDTIQSYSQDWSYYLLSNNLFQHSDTILYGENIAFFQGYGTDTMTLLKLAVDEWYNEIASYDFKNPGFTTGTGHFTCLVWASSKKFSIALSVNPTTSEVDIVLNTSPPGNVEGQYQSNVLQVLNPIPVPKPNPPIPPVPISNSAIILKIINDLHNIVYSINRHQPRFFVINYINIVIKEISSNPSIPNSERLIISLTNVLHAITKMGYSQSITIIDFINLIISQLKTNL